MPENSGLLNPSAAKTEEVNIAPVHQYNISFLWLTCLVAAMGDFLFGYDRVVAGGAKPFYEPFFNFTSPEMKGWGTSSALIGCKCSL